MNTLTHYKNLIRGATEAVAVLEYRKDVTIRQYGAKMLEQIKKDTFVRSPEFRYMAGLDRIATPEQTLDALFKLFESDIDPTPDHQYVPWIARVYAAGDLYEDLFLTGDNLEDYHYLKQHNLLKPEHRDIMRFKSRTDLRDVVDQYDNEIEMRSAAPDKAAAARGSAEVLLDTPALRVIQLNDETAARYYGQGTRWCTAADKRNMFDHYNDYGPLWVVLPKKPHHAGEKYQLHVQTSSYMDEKDSPVDLDDVVGRFNDEQFTQFITDKVVSVRVFGNITLKELTALYNAMYPHLTERAQRMMKYANDFVKTLPKDQRIDFDIDYYPNDFHIYIKDEDDDEVSEVRFYEDLQLSIGLIMLQNPEAVAGLINTFVPHGEYTEYIVNHLEFIQELEQMSGLPTYSAFLNELVEDVYRNEDGIYPEVNSLLCREFYIDEVLLYRVYFTSTDGFQLFYGDNMIYTYAGE